MCAQTIGWIVLACMHHPCLLARVRANSIEKLLRFFFSFFMSNVWARRICLERTNERTFVCLLLCLCVTGSNGKYSTYSSAIDWPGEWPRNRARPWFIYSFVHFLLLCFNNKVNLGACMWDHWMECSANKANIVTSWPNLALHHLLRLLLTKSVHTHSSIANTDPLFGPFGPSWDGPLGQANHLHHSSSLSGPKQTNEQTNKKLKRALASELGHHLDGCLLDSFNWSEFYFIYFFNQPKRTKKIENESTSLFKSILSGLFSWFHFVRRVSMNTINRINCCLFPCSFSSAKKWMLFKTLQPIGSDQTCLTFSFKLFYSLILKCVKLLIDLEQQKKLKNKSSEWSNAKKREEVCLLLHHFRCEKSEFFCFVIHNYRVMGALSPGCSRQPFVDHWSSSFRNRLWIFTESLRVYLAAWRVLRHKRANKLHWPCSHTLPSLPLRCQSRVLCLGPYGAH